MAPSSRHDGWTNVVTGLGDAIRDKRQSAQPAGIFLRQMEAEFLWRSDDMAARVVETIPHDGLRRGFNFTIKPNANRETEGMLFNPDALDGLPPMDLFSQLEPPELEQRRMGSQLGQRYDGLTAGDKQKIINAWALKQIRRLRARFDDAAVPVDPTMATDKVGDANKTKEDQEKVMAKHKLLGTVHAVRKAAEFERAYGGGAIFLGTIDTSPGRQGTLLARPLDLRFLQELRFLTVLSPMELVPYRYYGDPLAAKFGEVQIWTMVPKSKGISPRGSIIRIHESRLIIFKGIRTSRFMVEQQKGFGDSILNRAVEHIRNFSTSFDSAAVLISDFAQAVYKMKGLVELLQADGGELVKKRAQAMEYVRSTVRAMLIDSEEEFERKQTPVTGLPDLLDRMAQRLAAATDMPLTKLMGTQPTGLGATGQADRDWYNDNVSKFREDKAVPAFERITDVELHATEGALSGKVPDGWEITLPPLEEPNEAEVAKMRLANAQADVALIGAGVLHPEEVASSRYGGATYGTEIVLNDEVRKAAKGMLDVQEERAGELHDNTIKPPPDDPPPFAKKDGDDDQPREGNGEWSSTGSHGEKLANQRVHEFQANAAREAIAQHGYFSQSSMSHSDRTREAHDPAVQAAHASAKDKVEVGQKVTVVTKSPTGTTEHEGTVTRSYRAGSKGLLDVSHKAGEGDHTHTERQYTIGKAGDYVDRTRIGPRTGRTIKLK